MRYYEFALVESDGNPLNTKLAAVAGQIVARLKDTNSKSPISVQAFLNKLHDEEIELSRDDLEELIKVPPLSNLIANIQDNKVIFVGGDKQEQGDAIDPEKSSATLDRMAQQGAKDLEDL